MEFVNIGLAITPLLFEIELQASDNKNIKK